MASTQTDVNSDTTQDTDDVNFAHSNEDIGGQMTLVEHLDELRKRIFICAIAVVILTIVAFIFYNPILKFLLLPLPVSANEFSMVAGHPKLVVTGVGEGFSVVLKLSVAVGLALAAPVWLYQIWAFFSPALTKKERRYAIPFMLIGVGLFIAGIAVGFVTLRFPIQWLIGFGQNTFTELISANSYFSFVAFFLLAFGVVFELPLVLTFLAMVGIVNSAYLKKNRMYILIALWLISTIITPGSDPYSPVILSVALTVLFFISELLIRFIGK